MGKLFWYSSVSVLPGFSDPWLINLTLKIGWYWVIHFWFCGQQQKALHPDPKDVLG